MFRSPGSRDPGRPAPARRFALGSATLLAGWALGCAVPVATNLDEGAANEVVTVLGDNGVAADKSEDPRNEGRFSVDVGRGDVSYALSLMAREELPRTAPPGLADTLDDGALIPSRSDEHVRRLLGTAGELSRSLRTLEGVIAARVHLAAPPRDPLSGPSAPAVGPSASVLLKHRGARPPIASDEVRKLVAGAVPGMAPEQVVVVTQALPMPSDRAGTELVRLGPLTTTRSSLPYLRWMIACVAALNACMVALLFAMWLRSKRVLQNPPAGEPSLTRR